MDDKRKKDRERMRESYGDVHKPNSVHALSIIRYKETHCQLLLQLVNKTTRNKGDIGMWYDDGGGGGSKE